MISMAYALARTTGDATFVDQYVITSAIVTLIAVYSPLFTVVQFIQDLGRLHCQQRLHRRLKPVRLHINLDLCPRGG